MDENVVVRVKGDVICVCFSQLGLLGWDKVLSLTLRAAVRVLCLNFSTGIAEVKAVFSQRETASPRISKTTGAGIPYENKHTYQGQLAIALFSKFSHSILYCLSSHTHLLY